LLNQAHGEGCIELVRWIFSYETFERS